jgi:hypothetical protein
MASIKYDVESDFPEHTWQHHSSTEQLVECPKNSREREMKQNCYSQVGKNEQLILLVVHSGLVKGTSEGLVESRNDSLTRRIHGGTVKVLTMGHTAIRHGKVAMCCQRAFTCVARFLC